jgi:tetratricopeptide (TPR) repeat protein
LKQKSYAQSLKVYWKLLIKFNEVIMTEVLSPELLAKEGLNAFRDEDYAKAAQFFESAARGYAVEGDDPMAAEMRNNQSVALLKNGDAKGAYEAVEGTVEVFEKIADVRRQAMAWGNSGAALEGMKQLDQALEHYKKSAELLKEVNDPDLRAFVLSSISSLQLRTGHQLESLASMNAALDSKKKLSLKERLLKRLLEVPFKK